MRFFKEIIDEKFKDQGFRDFYKEECHICSTTVKLIAALEEKRQALSDILDTLQISKMAYEDLKEGENCNPRLVRQLCDHLGFSDSELFKNCRKL